MLTVVDVFTRECLAIEPGKSIRNAEVFGVFNQIATERDTPKRIHCDNGSVFAGRLVDLWPMPTEFVTAFLPRLSFSEVPGDRHCRSKGFWLRLSLRPGALT